MDGMFTCSQLHKGKLLLVVDVHVDGARPWAGCGATHSVQCIADKGGNVLLIGCWGQASDIDTPGMAGGLLRGSDSYMTDTKLSEWGLGLLQAPGQNGSTEPWLTVVAQGVLKQGDKGWI